MTPWAAKWAACWLEPHCRSTVVPGDGLGPAGREHGVAGDVDRLLADLHDAAHDDVVDDAGIDAVAIDEGLQRLGGEVDRVPVTQLAVALAERRAHGVDDHCSRSWSEPYVRARPRLGCHSCVERRSRRRRGDLVEDAAQGSDVAVAEPAGEVRCTARRYVTFISRHSSRPRRVSSTTTARWSSPPALAAHHPTLLGEAVETAAEARSDEAQLVGELRRAGRSAASLQGGEHVEPAERQVPLGAQRAYRSARSNSPAIDCSSRHAATRSSSGGTQSGSSEVRSDSGYSGTSR